VSRSAPPQPTAHITFTSWEEFGGFLGQSGSARGLFVRAEKPPPIGTEIRVHFVLPDGSDLTLAGRVVHSVNPLEAEALGEEPGMGVQFTHMSEEQGRALQGLMMKALSSPSLHPSPRAPRNAPTRYSSSPPHELPFAAAEPTTVARVAIPRAERAGAPVPPAPIEPRVPDNDPRIQEASSLLDRVRFDAAEQKVAEVLRERPGSFEGRLILFTAQARRAASQFDFQTAIDKYRALLQLDPEHAEAKSQLQLLQREAETSRALVERVFGPKAR
jgi:Tfp pilus assembly protein PilZ